MLSTAMATEKTAEGIRKFAADIAKLEKFVASKIQLMKRVAGRRFNSWI
jgi:hypothetical protein